MSWFFKSVSKVFFRSAVFHHVTETTSLLQHIIERRCLETHMVSECGAFPWQAINARSVILHDRQIGVMSGYKRARVSGIRQLLHTSIAWATTWGLFHMRSFEGLQKLKIQFCPHGSIAAAGSVD